MVTEINLENLDPVIAGPIVDSELTPEPETVTSALAEPVTSADPNPETPGLPPLIETKARHEAYKRRVEGMTPLTFGQWLALRTGDWIYVNNVSVFGTCIVSDVYSTRDATYIVLDNAYANSTLTFKRDETVDTSAPAILTLSDGSVFMLYALHGSRIATVG